MLIVHAWTVDVVVCANLLFCASLTARAVCANFPSSPEVVRGCCIRKPVSLSQFKRLVNYHF